MQEQLPFEKILSMCSDVVVVTDAQLGADGWPTIVYVNDAFVKLTGYSLEDMTGRSPAVLRGVHSDAEAHERVRLAVERGQATREVLVHYARSGRAYWTDIEVAPLQNAQGVTTHYVFISHDQQADRRIDTHLQKLEQIDTMTGVLNRRHLLAQAETHRQQAVKKEQPMSLLLITVDYFRSLVDIHGVDVGDQILTDLAQSIRASMPAGTLFGRIAGEEFAAVFPEKSIEEAKMVGEKIAVQARTLRLSELPWLSITVSVGVSCLERGDMGIAAMFSRASKAVEAGKVQGRNRVHTVRTSGQVIPFPQRESSAIGVDDSVQTGI
jgi:diguanylate cyclase (GGDEF)-like protein/PAS domain S-box-containing protein